MDYTNLIVALLGAAPGLATAIENWFQKNPRLQGETDQDYATRMNQQTLSMAADTTATDTQVEAG